MPSMSANHIAQFIRAQITCRLGVTKTLITERGESITSQKFNHGESSHGIRNAQAALYQPQNNDLVGAANKTISGII